MSDPRGESSRDTHIQEAPTSPGSGGERGDTRSVTYEADPSRREGMQQELMDLGVWLSEHPEFRKNLKPIRGSVVLKPGVYYNTGTGMVERIYAPQHVALGARWFRVKSDPGAPVEEIRRKVLEG
ncbi:MAG TPA: hypothetical protein VE225_07735, partial [Rubrobacteraceae bacterium]|nr:hypothetical protein [Rubrobacteraceae bacterium]